jgi:hypothetical protein
MADDRRPLSFNALVAALHEVHRQCGVQAGRAVNISLPLRNWLMGLYIAEYELHGADRAAYGENLLSALAERLTSLEISNCSRRQLYRYLRFYRLYPAIVRALSPQLRVLLPPGVNAAAEIVGTPSPQLAIPPERRARRHGQSALRLEVPARAAAQGGNPALPRGADAGGAAVKRCAVSTAATLRGQMAEAHKLDAVIEANLKALGYGG